MNVCQVVFSTARPEYLSRALASQRHLIWPEGYNVHKILFDDFPHNRDDNQIRSLAQAFGYTEVHLHLRNESLGATWRECWGLLKERNYDFVFTQEDDVMILEPINMLCLVCALKWHDGISQMRLARQAWYPGEPEPCSKPDDDLAFYDLRIEKNDSCVYFSPMASLYRGEVLQIDFAGWYRCHYNNEPALAAANPNEGLLGKALLEGWGQTARIVKNVHGGPLVHHMGNYTQGRILLPHEPSAERWLYRNPERRYCSKTGQPYA